MTRTLYHHHFDIGVWQNLLDPTFGVRVNALILVRVWEIVDVTSERLHPFEEREVNIVTAGRIGKSELQKKNENFVSQNEELFRHDW